MDVKECVDMIKDLSYIRHHTYPNITTYEYFKMLNIDYDKTSYECRYFCRICQVAFKHAKAVHTHLKSQKHSKNQVYLINEC
jgi:hypothetical protein